jgi:hypothetical protein
MDKEVYVGLGETARIGTAGGLDVGLLPDSLKVLAASGLPKGTPPIGIRISLADGDRNAGVPPKAVYRVNFFTRLEIAGGTMDKYAPGEIYVDANGAIVRGSDPTDRSDERRIHF